MASRNLETIKSIWGVFEREGVRSGMEALLAACAAGVELRPYTAGGRTLRGSDELRDFWGELLAAGGWLSVGAYEFAEHGDDEVVVTGWIRVSREGGDLSDTQLRWVFAMRDGLIVRAVAEPLTSA